MKHKGQFKKGMIPWNKGMKGLKSWNKGKNKYTDVRIRRSRETIEKQKKTMNEKFSKGELKIWNKGLYGVMKFSKEHNERVRLSRIGKKHNKESIDKMRLIKLGKKYSLDVINKRIPKIKEARKYQILPIKDTSIELKIQSFLKQLGITFFTHQYIKEIEHGYQCDILIPSLNLVIECDGDYWHKYPIGNDIDHIRTNELIEKGFKVLRLWEHEIKIMDIDKFRKMI